MKSTPAFSAICIGAFVSSGCVGVAANPQETSNPAHAIELVLDTRQADILEVDSPDSWWHDTKQREWSVKRPFEPGVLDTTHTFVVSYSIGGTVVAEWDVDTRAATAVQRERPN